MGTPFPKAFIARSVTPSIVQSCLNSLPTPYSILPSPPPVSPDEEPDVIEDGPWSEEMDFLLDLFDTQSSCGSSSSRISLGILQMFHSPRLFNNMSGPAICINSASVICLSKALL